MYYINKIVGWCLSPLGIMFLGLGLAWVLNWRGWKKTARWCLGLVLAAIWVLGCGVTMRIVGVPLERMSGSGCVLDYERIPEGDAIVLLGGGMGYHKKCGAAEMFNGADRVWVAAKLWKAGKAKVITLSGGDADKSTVPLLKEMGVDEKACVCFLEARNTEEESKMIKALGAKKILLVTSAWHMPRARMLFERRGFEVVACPADFEMSCGAEQPIEFKDFFPSADGLRNNSYCVKEWVGLAGYSVLRR